MSNGSSPLISVIVPARDAAATIGRTLASALAQTHRNIEVLVVDDGSTDDTARIVGQACRADARVRLIVQANGGVAVARNSALRQSIGQFVAPLDADDLWAPDKLELQLAALQRSPRAALAYAWFRRIDAADRILPPSPHPRFSGRVLHRHLAWNFISNGSAILVRGDVARAIGFDERLNGGCEDYLHQLMIALEHDFVCVPRFLVGYRSSGGSLSASRSRMERAHLAMFDILAPLLPAEALPVLRQRQAEMHARLARHHWRAGELRAGWEAARQAFGADSTSAISNFAGALRSLARQAPEGVAGTGPDFATLDTAEPDGAWRTRRRRRRLDWLARLDGLTP